MQYFGFDRPSFLSDYFGFGLSVFDPVSLFAGGKQGVLYDPSKLASLWQNAERTIPVTANGDPVGCVDDLSGNGNHAKQAVSAARPVYKTDGILHWLEFDGVDDDLLTNYNKLSTETTKASVYLVIDLLMGSNEGYILNSDGSNGNTSTHGFSVLRKSASEVRFSIGGNPNSINPDNSKHIYSAVFDKTNNTGFIRIQDTETSIVVGDYSSQQNLLIGSRVGGANGKFNLYSLVVLDRLYDDRNGDLRKYIAKKTGVVL